MLLEVYGRNIFVSHSLVWPNARLLNTRHLTLIKQPHRNISNFLLCGFTCHLCLHTDWSQGRPEVMLAAKCMRAFLMYTSVQLAFKNFHFPLYQFCSSYPSRFRTAEARMDSQATSDTYGDQDSGSPVPSCLRSSLASTHLLPWFL